MLEGPSEPTTVCCDSTHTGYDARGYRIRKDTYVSGTLDEQRHYYFTPGWQCVEERVDSSSDADRQFVWGSTEAAERSARRKAEGGSPTKRRDLVLRDRDTDGNGTLDERRYGLQEGNWNKQASTPTDEGGESASAVVRRFLPLPLTGTSSTVTERFAYSAYGSPVFMNGSGTVQSSSASGFETLYAGYRWDGNSDSINTSG